MSFFSWCQIVRFIMLVPNCPGAKLSGAKLSVFIMLVPNCPGAKLSGAKLSWCQIVLVPNCPVPNCPTTFWDAERVHRRLLPRRQILHSSHSFCCLYPAEIDLTWFKRLNQLSHIGYTHLKMTTKARVFCLLKNWLISEKWIMSIQI